MHLTPPTHAMQIFRYAETGSIRMLWIIATNPAVSLPELARIREICDNDNLFLVVQDAWLTETAGYKSAILLALYGLGRVALPQRDYGSAHEFLPRHPR